MAYQIDHVSFSQYSSYTSCPRSWYLKYVQGAESTQTWFLPLGSAVHESIESHLKGVEPDPTEIFYRFVSKQMEIEPDTSKWLAGGPADNPIIEDLALKKVHDCYAKALEFLDDIEVHEVELDASGNLPGLDVPIKAYIDILGEHKKHGPVIVDWKTGTTKPKNAFQLETYAALLQQRDTTTYNTGLWAMLSPGASKARPVDLSGVSPKAVGAKYQAVVDKMRQKLYQANAGYMCRFCFQQENCKLNAGPTKRALYYDKAEDDGFPF